MIHTPHPAHPGRLLGGLVALSAAAALAVEAALAGPFDTAGDTAEMLADASAPLRLIGPLTVIAVVLTALVHHVCAAVAARAAAGRHLPIAELYGATFTAAAANRVTPAGLGGATVLGRFFVRRGRLEPAEATAAVSALAVLGALADIAAFAMLVGLGFVLGVPQMAREAPLLLSRLVSLLPVAALPWVAAGLALVLIVIGLLAWRGRGRPARDG